MSDKKQISGVRTDMSLNEFKRNLIPETPRMKREKLGKKVKGVLDFFGLMDDGSTASKGGGINLHTSHTSSSQDFRASQRVEPQPRTHEQWVIEQTAHKAYHKMVDGKGDHDCGHEH